MYESGKQKLERKGSSDWDSSRHVAAANLSSSPPFFSSFTLSSCASCWTCARSLVNNEVSIDRCAILSARSRVEIDKCRVRTSITYLTGALDSFGVKKLLRFPPYRLSRPAVALLPPPLLSALVDVSHNGLESRSISDTSEPTGELSPSFQKSSVK